MGFGGLFAESSQSTPQDYFSAEEELTFCGFAANSASKPRPQSLSWAELRALLFMTSNSKWRLADFAVCSRHWLGEYCTNALCLSAWILASRALTLSLTLAEPRNCARRLSACRMTSCALLRALSIAAWSLWISASAIWSRISSAPPSGRASLLMALLGAVSLGGRSL